MDLPAFAASLLPRAEQLLHELFPAGKWNGKEFQVGDITGAPGKSLSVNSLTGAWCDFASPEMAGGDLLSLYAARHGLKQSDAAKQLGWRNGSSTTPATPALPDPIPDDPPPLPGTPPTALYKYGSAFWIARYDAPTGKSFKPWTWRNGKWAAKGYPAPRPLYGIDLLPSGKRVLLVEGEKACEAARQLFGPLYSVLTWAGGAAATNTVNWEPLYGRDVDLWPDADEPGNKAMAAIVERLLPHIRNCKVRILAQDGQPEGWDIADAVADGWDMARITAHILRDNSTHIKTWNGKELQKGRPADGTPAITVNEDPAQRSARGWHEHLQLDASDRGPYETEDNAARILAQHPQFAGRLWLDEFANALMLGDKPLDKLESIQILVYFQQHLGIRKLPLLAIERAALLVGSANKRNPPKQWLNALAWDGTERLTTLMADGFGAAQNDYTAAVGRCWLTSMVARVLEPGCQADYMPVFEGKQGIYKSSAMRILGGQWFTENHYSPIKENKDFLQGLQGYWLIEIPEMDSIAGAADGIRKIKGVITNRVDKYREPYGVKLRPYPRQCIFAGTTNEETWATDPTGGRRFWPIQCGEISKDYLTSSREQLFAEALHYYNSAHEWHQVPYGMATEEQDARRERHPWEDIIAMHLYNTTKQQVSITEILEGPLNCKPIDMTQRNSNIVARCLLTLGWKRRQIRVATNRYQWFYVPGVAPQQQSIITDEF